MKKKILIIIQREYFEKIRRPMFWAMNFITPLLFIIGLIFTIYLSAENAPNYRVLIYAENEPTLAFIQALQLQDNEKLKIKFFYTTTYIHPSDLKNSPYNVEIYLDPEVLINLQTTPKKPALIPLIFTQPLSGFAETYIRNMLETKFERLKMQYFYQNKGLTEATIKEFDQIKVRLTFDPISAKEGEVQKIAMQKIWLGLFFAFLVAFFIFSSAYQVMRSILEEKTNRIVEIIISSVRPFTWMMGKILGITLVALTRFFIFFSIIALFFFIFQYYMHHFFYQIQNIQTSVGFFSSIFSSPEPNRLDDFLALLQPEFLSSLVQDVNYPLMLGFFLFYFIFGYLLYAALYAIIAAGENTVHEFSTWILPLSLPLCFSLLFAYFTLDYPDGNISVIGSIFPFTSPILMLIRISHGIAPHQFWQLFLSMFLLVSCFVLVLIFAGKMYRKRILIVK